MNQTRPTLLERFLQIESSSGIVLLCATLAALLWANSPWQASYELVWHLNVARVSPRFVVNDGLMTIFFLVVGLEIRREMHDGALSSLRAASVPVIAALGGMIVPALIFLALADSSIRQGWAIPTATDIAFAVGALTLLGKRVPPQARVLLLALAVIDDIGAILMIAFFYSSGIEVTGLLLAVGGMAGVWVFQKFGIRSALAYVVPGAIVWFGLHHAGVHPTLAGVILGLMTPVSAGRLEHTLHPWVAYGIMPLFALANAGVALDGVKPGGALMLSAIGLALVVGKPLGIVSFTWLAVRSRIGALAPGLDWRSVVLVGGLGGIGFTMSIFLSTLAFADPGLLAAAKAAVLLGSAVAGVGAFIVGKTILFPRPS